MTSERGLPIGIQDFEKLRTSGCLYVDKSMYVYQTGVKSASGWADAVVKTADSIYVFEFKMTENATAEDALAQINDRGYLIPYTADSRRLVKVGVEFSIGVNGVKRWLTESM